MQILDNRAAATAASGLALLDASNTALPLLADPSADQYVALYDAGLGLPSRMAVSTLVPDLDGVNLNFLIGDTSPAVYQVRSQDRAPRYHDMIATTDRVADLSHVDIGPIYIFLTKYAPAGKLNLAFGSDGIVTAPGGITSPGQMLEIPNGCAVAVIRTSVAAFQVVYFVDPNDRALRLTTLSAATNTIAKGDLNSIFLLDTTANAVAATLPSFTGLPEGTYARFIFVTGSNSASIFRVGTGLVQAQIFSPGDEVTLVISGGAWKVLAKRVAPLFVEYRSAGTYTVTPPAGSVRYKLFLMGAASGGGSGRRGAAATARFGGNGGTPGTYMEAEGLVAALPASVTMVVGAGGAGGASVAADSTDGNAGGAGNATTFGTSASAYYASALGGPAGQGGKATSSSNTAPTQGIRPSGTGATSVAAAAVQGTRTWAPGAPSGGGISVADAPGAALGGYGRGWVVSATGVDQAASTGSVLSGIPKAGASGAASITAAAERGYNGADGGPGGGGGASLNGFASGAGGAGSDGWAVIRWEF